MVFSVQNLVRGMELPPGYNQEALQQLVDITDHQEAEIERLRAAINWALGETDTFHTRGDGEGAYWWRKELRHRAYGVGVRHEKARRTLIDDAPPTSPDKTFNPQEGI